MRQMNVKRNLMMENCKQENRYKLAAGVYYRLAGDSVYVRNVTTRYDYLFNPMVKDILDILREERTKSELLAELEKTYDIEHADGFSDQLGGFLKAMVDKGVIDAKRPQSEHSLIPDAEGTAKGFYQKNHKLWNACFELTYLCNERCRHCYLVSAHQRTDFGEGANFSRARTPQRRGIRRERTFYAASSCTSTRSNDGRPSGASMK